MATVNLKNFVNINIQKHIKSLVAGTRDTVVLFTTEGTTEKATVYNDLDSFIADKNEDILMYVETQKYLKVYFDNGGQSVIVVENMTFDSSFTTSILSELDDKYIGIAFVNGTYDFVKDLASSLEADSTVYGINEKILVARTEEIKEDSVKNFAVKYSTVTGAEMTILAYLSQIDVYAVNSINDYAFTIETLTVEDITDDEYKDIITNNMNVAIKLANADRNCGGNLKNGDDIVNNFVRIVLHQTTTTQLLNLLASKIKGSHGIGKIHSVLNQELNRYLTSGYLTTDKIWTEKSMIVNYNGENYMIIQENESLPKGFKILILPFTALTDAEKQQKKSPPIYVILADQYGIRSITITGEVI